VVIMRKTMIVMTMAFALIVGACAGDATESDEYQQLQAELTSTQQQLTSTQQQLTSAQQQLAEATAQLAEASTRHDASLETIELDRQVLDDPESYGTEDEVVDLLASHATDDAVMDDAVFGAAPMRQAWHNTLYGGAIDARIDAYDTWVSDDGSQGGVLWIWYGTNAEGNPFELAGISLLEFDEEGRIAYEFVTYPYPDAYVNDAVFGAGTPTPSTG
jgi:hypothetical protein